MRSEIFNHFHPNNLNFNYFLFKEDEEKRVFNLKEAFWFCVTTLTPIGGGEVPKNPSGRLVSAT